MTRRRLLLCLLLASVVTVAMTLAATRGGGRALGRADLEAYERQVVPIVQDGGRVVEQGIKPAIDDLQYRHIVPATVIATEGDGWVRSLTSVRERLSRVAAPAVIRPVTTSLLAALDGYIQAARSFSAAARSIGAKRVATLKIAFEQAVAADRIYDHGSSQLQKLRHSLGLPANPNFPEVPGA